MAGEAPRIGVFVCHCGKNIGGYVDVPAVREYAKALPDVAFAMDNLYTCSSDAQTIIKEKIREHGLNRVVVASCSPRTHEPLFQQTIRETGPQHAPLRDGEHPRPGLVGAHGPPARGHGEGQGPGAHGRGQGPAHRAAAARFAARARMPPSWSAAGSPA